MPGREPSIDARGFYIARLVSQHLGRCELGGTVRLAAYGSPSLRATMHEDREEDQGLTMTMTISRVTQV